MANLSRVMSVVDPRFGQHVAWAENQTKIDPYGTNEWFIIATYAIDPEFGVATFNFTQTLAPEEKPPIGLKPKYIHDYDRSMDILAAMKRYNDVGKEIPEDWFSELAEIIEELK